MKLGLIRRGIGSGVLAVAAATTIAQCGRRYYRVRRPTRAGRALNQGMSIQNVERILPEYQTLQAGDTLDKNKTMAVHYVDEGRSLVLGPPTSVGWLQALIPLDGFSTRLITRVRASAAAPVPIWGYCPSPSR